MNPTHTFRDVEIYAGDCLAVLPTLPDASVDCCICDPPYPEIDRSYGRWTEAEWWEMMVDGVIPQVRRVLKPTGSAVFILQPNSRKVGSMRGWLWKFMWWVAENWNMVQDVWWWNHTSLPNAGANAKGLLRPSLKACIWTGESDCYRNQQAVLQPISERHANRIKQYDGQDTSGRVTFPSGLGMDYARSAKAAANRGGTTPFNVLPVHHGAGQSSAGAHGHGAGTPLALARWWTRYICPPGGVVLDPFLGSGTMALAALDEGRRCIGIERVPEYVEIARKRVAEAVEATATPLLDSLEDAKIEQPSLF